MRRRILYFVVCAILFLVAVPVYAEDDAGEDAGDEAAAEDEEEEDEEEEEEEEDDDDDGDTVIDETKTEKGVVDGFTEEQREKISGDSEKHEFQAEVSRLMDIIINSLYSNKEIFLREIISNSADALEKARFLSVQDKDFLGERKDLDVRLEYDADAKTVTIADSGIGMTKQDLINNLGTVAKSGTTNFLEAMAGGADVNLIGQFGVGFYSTFLVADQVTVTSKNNDDEQQVWISTADASFTVSEDPRGDTLGRGTRVTLRLKEDATEFLSESKLRDLAKKFSQFINFPIYLRVKKEKEEDIPIEGKEEEKKEKKEKKEDDDEDEDEDEDEEEEEKKTKKIKRTVWEWEQVNTQKALWLRSKEDITDEEYNEFYKALTKDYQEPMAWSHFTAEGEIEFKAILYIPGKAPWDMFDNYFSKQSQLKLYVRRVLVAEEFEDLMPRYLHFVRGVVDSDDLPLNVSREALQQHKIMKVISKKLVRKALELMKKIAKESESADDDEDDEDDEKEEEEKEDKEEDDEDKEKEKEDKEKEKKAKAEKYDDFYKQFGRNLKLGCYEDDGNRSKLSKLLRFISNKSGDKFVSLDKYVENMKESQEGIYYMAGENIDALRKSPLLQKFEKKDLEVIFLTDTMDEPCVQKVIDYEGKKFTSIQKGEVNLDDTEEEKKRSKRVKEMFEPLLKWWKEQLTGKVESVVISQRLISDPVAVVSSSFGYSPYMEKVMKSQAFTNKDDVKSMSGKKMLEINPNSIVIQNLLKKVKDDEKDESAIKAAKTLFGSAVLASGYDMENPTELAELVYSMVASQDGIEGDGIQEVELPPEEEEDEDEEGEDDEKEDDEEKEDDDAEEAPKEEKDEL